MVFRCHTFHRQTGVRFFPIRAPLLSSPTTSVVLIVFSGEYTLLLYSRMLTRRQSLDTLTDARFPPTRFHLLPSLPPIALFGAHTFLTLPPPLSSYLTTSFVSGPLNEQIPPPNDPLDYFYKIRFRVIFFPSSLLAALLSGADLFAITTAARISA